MTFIIAVAACALLLIAAITGLAMLALSREKPNGSHARRPRPQDDPDAAGQDDSPDPFADPDEADPDKSADEFVAALHDDGEPEPVLAAPVAAELEPAPPLDRREFSAMPARTAAGMTLPAWEPPVDRGTLESIRDALRAWTPAPAAPQEPEPEPEPEPVTPGDNTKEIFVRITREFWKPAAEMADEIEMKVYGSVAAKSSSDGKDFAGTSLPGLPGEDRDLPQPVLARAADGMQHDGHEAGAR